MNENKTPKGMIMIETGLRNAFKQMIRMYINLNIYQELNKKLVVSYNAKI